MKSKIIFKNPLLEIPALKQGRNPILNNRRYKNE